MDGLFCIYFILALLYECSHFLRPVVWIVVLISFKFLLVGNMLVKEWGFFYLFRHAGIPCLQVQGHAKEQYHDLEEKFTDEGKPTHAWNIVHVKGEWRPLDVTWGTGCTDNGGTFKRKFDEHWFLTDPADFVCKHYPLDKR